MSNFFYRNFKKEYPVAVEASGVWITDASGRKYLDGCSGAIVSNIGYGVRSVTEAVAAQMSVLPFAHTSQFVTEPALKLAEKLAELVFPESTHHLARMDADCKDAADKDSDRRASRARVYFTSGGSEATETALKLARSYWLEKGEHRKWYYISRRPSYHGSTFGAMHVTGHPARRKPYEPLLDSTMSAGGSCQIEPPYPYRCLCGASASCHKRECASRYASLLEETIVRLGAANVAAFIAEPVIGAALGACVPPDGYWQDVSEICRRHGVLLISDEIMTGLGRCGYPLGLDRWDVKPDIAVLSKGLAAGYMPLGAVVASGGVAAAIEGGSGVFEHGFTYSGHPASAAAGLAVLDYLSQNQLFEKVRQGEEAFLDQLRRASDCGIVGDVRGCGYLFACELVRDKTLKEPFAAEEKMSQLVARAALEEGLLIYPGSDFLPGGGGDHIMVAPAFNMSHSEMSQLFERLERALAKTMSRVMQKA